jgi:hypothetical protein
MNDDGGVQEEDDPPTYSVAGNTEWGFSGLDSAGNGDVEDDAASTTAQGFGNDNDSGFEGQDDSDHSAWMDDDGGEVQEIQRGGFGGGGVGLNAAEELAKDFAVDDDEEESAPS